MRQKYTREVDDPFVIFPLRCPFNPYSGLGYDVAYPGRVGIGFDE